MISDAIMVSTLSLICLVAAVAGVGLGSPSVNGRPAYYTAAVFEYSHMGDPKTDRPLQLIRRNLDMYEKAGKVAAQKGADIIVFPEYGIFFSNTRNRLKAYLEHTPDPRIEFTNPCDRPEEFSNRPILLTLSCLAKRNKIVVVANTGDIQPCSRKGNSKCPEDGAFHFNTNVAFDKNGTLISRYYKEHLYYELGMDLPQEPQNPVFTTDFGTFAMYICFDIIFYNMVEASKKVDNVILSTLWFNQPPLMNSIQLWEGWALGNNVTFLASNIQMPGYFAVGSGMFSGRTGAIKYTNSPDGLSKLIVSKVPRSKHHHGAFSDPDSSITVITQNSIYTYDEAKDGKDFPEHCSNAEIDETTNVRTFYRCFPEDTSNYTFVKLTKRSDSLKACSNGVCCHLNYSASSMNEDFYLGVYNGTYKLTRYSWCVENCLVVRCDPKGKNPCGSFPTRSKTVFQRLDLKADFSTRYVYPSVMLNSGRLPSSKAWSYELQANGDHSFYGRIAYRNDFQDPLLVAGFNGRCYSRDPPYER